MTRYLPSSLSQRGHAVSLGGGDPGRVLEALMDLGLVLGAILVRVAIAIGGLKAALFAPGVVALLLIVGLARQIHKIDGSATVPQVEIQLLRSISIFAALPAPSLEGVARELQPLTVSPGTAVITEGEHGDCYYAVADGELAISRQGHVVQMVSRRDGFGEIALIRDVPRQASVTAVTDASLYALHKELFVRTVTGHAAASSVARTIIAGHLAGETRTDAMTVTRRRGKSDRSSSQGMARVREPTRGSQRHCAVGRPARSGRQ